MSCFEVDDRVGVGVHWHPAGVAARVARGTPVGRAIRPAGDGLDGGIPAAAREAGHASGLELLRFSQAALDGLPSARVAADRTGQPRPGCPDSPRVRPRRSSHRRADLHADRLGEVDELEGIPRHQLHGRHADHSRRQGRLRALLRLSRRGRQARGHVDDQVPDRAPGRDSRGRGSSGRGCARRHHRPRAGRQRLRLGHGSTGHGHDDRAVVQRGLRRSRGRHLGVFGGGEPLAQAARL